jgi:replicative DNA helicase
MAQSPSARKGRGEALRAIPADHEAEQSVLAAILLDHDALHRILDRLRADDFDHPRHRILYQACVSLAEKNQAPTLIALKNHLEEHSLLESVGGIAFVAGVADAAATAAHIEHHARIVRDKALSRTLIRTCEGLAARGYEATTPVQDLVEEAERAVLRLGMGYTDLGFTALGEDLESTFDFIDRIQRGEITGVHSGFNDFDKLTGGFNGGDLIILAARPSIGKTALALNMARNCSVDYGGCVGVFSLEMSKRQLILRLLMAEAEVDFSRLRNGMLGDRDWPGLTRAADVLTDARIFIDDSSAISVFDIAARARRLHREHKLTLMIVDYIQLIQSRRASDRREQEVAEITRALKLLAKELDVPIVALSQLNRGPETRPGGQKRPLLADLRESGAIEQDADTVLFIYRDEFYNEDTEDKGIAEIIVAKQRNGPTGTIKLQFQSEYAKFHDHTGREAPPPYAGFDPDGGVVPGGEPEPPF